MKLKALALALFATGLLAGLTLIAPATGADGPTTTTTPFTPTPGVTYTTGSGTIAALSDASITVGSLTCSRNSSSPSLAGYKLGDQVGIACGNGVLVLVSDHRTTTTTPTTTTTSSPPPTTTTTPNEQGARDPITALSATSITVGPLTCSIGPSSPAIAFHVGDRVRLGCTNGVVVYVVADTPPPTTTTTTPDVITKSGTLTAIGSNTITVDGTVCAVYPPASPSITAFKIGDHVGIACQNAVLVKIVALTDSTSGSSGDSQTVTRGGTITALGNGSITVNDFSCKVLSTSPSLDGYKVGDTVGIACVSGVLAKIERAGTPPPPPAPDVLQTRLGAISALSAGSITVDGLTCAIKDSSPSVAAFAVGDMVGIGCSNGVLVKIGNAPYGGDDGGFKVAVAIGPIARLSSDLIRVGNLACELATTSPSVASYQVGDRVGIGCAGGILFMIGALPSADDAPAADVKHALVKRFNTCIKKGNERCTVASVLKRFAK
jgi:hypothetical protein